MDSFGYQKQLALIGMVLVETVLKSILRFHDLIRPSIKNTFAVPLLAHF